MEEKNLRLAQQEIEDALKAVEDIETVIDTNNSKEVLKEKFLLLSNKVQELEDILKTEGIL